MLISFNLVSVVNITIPNNPIDAIEMARNERNPMILIMAENSLILTVKWFDSSATVPTENSLLRDRLIKAANDLNKFTPGVEDYDFIERDVQHFTDMRGKKYTLSVVIRLFDDRTTDISGTNF